MQELDASICACACARPASACETLHVCLAGSVRLLVSTSYASIIHEGKVLLWGSDAARFENNTRNMPVSATCTPPSRDPSRAS